MHDVNYIVHEAQNCDMYVSYNRSQCFVGHQFSLARYEFLCKTIFYSARRIEIKHNYNSVLLQKIKTLKQKR